MELQGQGIGLSDMLNAMASQQPVYTVPAYTGIDPTYAQYPQYVAQVTHPAYLATTAAPIVSHSIREGSYERYESSSNHRDRDRDRRERDRDREHRSRDYDRDHRDRRDRDRDRERRRSSRDRSRERDRDRYRDHDRDRSPRRERSRDRDRSREKDRDYDRESIYDDERDYKSMAPNNTIMVRGLAQHITENDIRADILACNLIPKDIRLVRKKESGASRGFAFVEFTTIHDAASWMETKQGVLIIQDVYRATLQFSIPKDGCDRQVKQSQDWFCVKCGAHNFKRRDSCFKCAAPRHESELSEDGHEEICNYPTNTLILRCLDVLSTEESILQCIQPVCGDLPIRSVRIGRDPLTNTSRGVCYVELNSVLDSMQLYNKLTATPVVIDSRQISIDYCKLQQHSNNSSNSVQQHVQPLEYTAGADVKKLAEYAASVYAQTPEEHSAYLEYYTQYYQQQADASTGTQSDSVNAAAAVAQSALQAMQQKSGIGNKSSTYNSSPSEKETTPTSSASVQEDYPKYPTPDVSTYTYDESSGYYYDPSTGLYYDANSTYYYNSETCQYLYWDAERSTYLPAPTGEEGQEWQDSRKDKKDKDKQDKVKVAKKIAKDMERWAKAQNKRTETNKPQAEVSGIPQVENYGAADAAFAVLLERRPDKPAAIQNNIPKDVQPIIPPAKKTTLVAAYGGENSDSEEEREPEKEEQLIDVLKMACLLCKRQFPNKEALTKHVNLSSLHKKNLEVRAKQTSDSLQQYRDRAKERREKYGQPNAPPPNKLKERYMAAREEVEASKFDEPKREPIGDDNIGNKLMKKMGWTDGMGLGKSNQGRTSIIEADRRVATAGLGLQGSSYGATAGSSYKDSVKKLMMQRYNQIDSGK